jgi:hypothetical protein
MNCMPSNRLGLGAFQELRQWVLEIAAIGRRHHDMSARFHELFDLLQKLVRMRDMPDNLGDQHHVKTPIQAEVENIAGGKLRSPGSCFSRT